MEVLRTLKENSHLRILPWVPSTPRTRQRAVEEHHGSRGVTLSELLPSFHAQISSNSNTTTYTATPNITYNTRPLPLPLTHSSPYHRIKNPATISSHSIRPSTQRTNGPFFPVVSPLPHTRSVDLGPTWTAAKKWTPVRFEQHCRSCGWSETRRVSSWSH